MSPRMFLRIVAGLSALMAVDCSGSVVSRAPDSDGRGAASTAPLSAATATAPPEEVTEERVEALEVEGFPPSVVVVPATDRPAPVVVVGHGAGGRPEPHCDFYRALVRGRGFILCTRGRSMDAHLPESERGYFYDGHIELGKEVRAAVAALVRRYGARVDLERSVYAGFSQGATMGILALQQGVAPDARVGGILLVEGGWREWTVALAQKLADEGVRRVAIVCGQTVCKEEGDRSVGWIRRGGLEVELLHAPGAGHTYGGAVAPLVGEAWRWIVEGDPRWAAD
jgi:predicted esterase